MNVVMERIKNRDITFSSFNPKFSKSFSANIRLFVQKQGQLVHLCLELIKSQGMNEGLKDENSLLATF